MRRRNRRQFFNEERETKKIVIISLSVLIIAVVAFIITFLIYNNYIDKNIEIAQNNKSSITELMSVNEQNLWQASSNIGKSVNEVKEESKSNEGNTQINKIAINTSNMEKEETNTEEEPKAATEETKNEVKQPEAKKEEVPDPTFSKPVEGEISTEFAKDTLIYSNTLKEWVTHMGVDIKAEKATVVKAAAEGKVKSIKNDPRYGITVVVEHVNGFKTIYSNLLTAEFVNEEETVKKGQTLGTVGNTATFEIADAPHLHFEIQKNDVSLDPTLYLK